MSYGVADRDRVTPNNGSYSGRLLKLYNQPDEDSFMTIRGDSTDVEKYSKYYLSQFHEGTSSRFNNSNSNNSNNSDSNSGSFDSKTNVGNENRKEGSLTEESDIRRLGRNAISKLISSNESETINRGLIRRGDLIERRDVVEKNMHDLERDFIGVRFGSLNSSGSSRSMKTGDVDSTRFATQKGSIEYNVNTLPYTPSEVEISSKNHPPNMQVPTKNGKIDYSYLYKDELRFDGTSKAVSFSNASSSKSIRDNSSSSSATTTNNNNTNNNKNNNNNSSSNGGSSSTSGAALEDLTLIRKDIDSLLTSLKNGDSLQTKTEVGDNNGLSKSSTGDAEDCFSTDRILNTCKSVNFEMDGILKSFEKKDQMVKAKLEEEEARDEKLKNEGRELARKENSLAYRMLMELNENKYDNNGEVLGEDVMFNQNQNVYLFRGSHNSHRQTGGLNPIFVRDSFDQDLFDYEINFEREGISRSRLSVGINSELTECAKILKETNIPPSRHTFKEILSGKLIPSSVTPLPQASNSPSSNSNINSNSSNSNSAGDITSSDSIQVKSVPTEADVNINKPSSSALFGCSIDTQNANGTISIMSNQTTPSAATSKQVHMNSTIIKNSSITPRTSYNPSSGAVSARDSVDGEGNQGLRSGISVLRVSNSNSTTMAHVLGINSSSYSAPSPFNISTAYNISPSNNNNSILPNGASQALSTSLGSGQSLGQGLGFGSGRVGNNIEQGDADLAFMQDSKPFVQVTNEIINDLGESLKHLESSFQKPAIDVKKESEPVISRHKKEAEFPTIIRSASSNFANLNNERGHSSNIDDGRARRPLVIDNISNPIISVSDKVFSSVILPVESKNSVHINSSNGIYTRPVLGGSTFSSNTNVPHHEIDRSMGRYSPNRAQLNSVEDIENRGVAEDNFPSRVKSKPLLKAPSEGSSFQDRENHLKKIQNLRKTFQ